MPRPIPPPASRASVLEQFDSITAWTDIDGDISMMAVEASHNTPSKRLFGQKLNLADVDTDRKDTERKNLHNPWTKDVGESNIEGLPKNRVPSSQSTTNTTPNCTSRSNNRLALQAGEVVMPAVDSSRLSTTTPSTRTVSCFLVDEETCGHPKDRSALSRGHTDGCQSLSIRPEDFKSWPEKVAADEIKEIMLDSPATITKLHRANCESPDKRIHPSSKPTRTMGGMAENPITIAGDTNAVSPLSMSSGHLATMTSHGEHKRRSMDGTGSNRQTGIPTMTDVVKSDRVLNSLKTSGRQSDGCMSTLSPVRGLQYPSTPERRQAVAGGLRNALGDGIRHRHSGLFPGSRDGMPVQRKIVKDDEAVSIERQLNFAKAVARNEGQYRHGPDSSSSMTWPKNGAVSALREAESPSSTSGSRPRRRRRQSSPLTFEGYNADGSFRDSPEEEGMSLHVPKSEVRQNTVSKKSGHRPELRFHDVGRNDYPDSPLSENTKPRTRPFSSSPALQDISKDSKPVVASPNFTMDELLEPNDVVHAPAAVLLNGNVDNGADYSTPGMPSANKHHPKPKGRLYLLVKKRNRELGIDTQAEALDTDFDQANMRAPTFGCAWKVAYVDSKQRSELLGLDPAQEKIILESFWLGKKEIYLNATYNAYYEAAKLMIMDSNTTAENKVDAKMGVSMKVEVRQQLRRTMDAMMKEELPPHTTARISEIARSMKRRQKDLTAVPTDLNEIVIQITRIVGQQRLQWLSNERSTIGNKITMLKPSYKAVTDLIKAQKSLPTQASGRTTVAISTVGAITGNPPHQGQGPAAYTIVDGQARLNPITASSSLEAAPTAPGVDGDNDTDMTPAPDTEVDEGEGGEDLTIEHLIWYTCRGMPQLFPDLAHPVVLGAIVEGDNRRPVDDKVQKLAEEIVSMYNNACRSRTNGYLFQKVFSYQKDSNDNFIWLSVRLYVVKPEQMDLELPDDHTPVASVKLWVEARETSLTEGHIPEPQQFGVRYAVIPQTIRFNDEEVGETFVPCFQSTIKFDDALSALYHAKWMFGEWCKAHGHDEADTQRIAEEMDKEISSFAGGEHKLVGEEVWPGFTEVADIKVLSEVKNEETGERVVVKTIKEEYSISIWKW